MDEVECELCGGTNFYKDAGHFYCKECQTQTQEIQEHVFDAEVTDFGRKSTVKIQKETKKNDKITSWECYNVILFKLTKQLINLGADSRLKPVVKCLWIAYLEKMEVVGRGGQLPKLSIVNSQRDKGILYGETKKKRRRSVSTSSVNSSQAKRERSRKKRELAQSQLEELNKTNNEIDETLESPSSGSEKSITNQARAMYNTYSINELKKKSKTLRSKKIISNKLTYKTVSEKFVRSGALMSINKIYALLYLGLLIIRDQMQLGEILRFINEGHLSYNYYSNLFEDIYIIKELNLKNYAHFGNFGNKKFRTAAGNLANFLGLSAYICCPDLLHMTSRFCQELNLPDELSECVKNLITKAIPKLQFTQKSGSIPNYEGRIMSMILIVIKLIFGLDDHTEYEFSKYAKTLDALQTKKMFDIELWMKHLEYRNVIINEYHFPTQYINTQGFVNSDLYLQYISTKPKQYDEDKRLHKDLEQYKQVLTSLKENQEYISRLPIEFPSSLTPFREYTNIITPYIPVTKYLKDILEADFKTHSLEYLLRPNEYLKLVNSLDKKHGGANDKLQFYNITNPFVERQYIKKHHDKKLITVQCSEHDDKNLIEEEVDKKISTVDPELYLYNYDKGKKYIFDENEAYIQKLSKSVSLNLTDNVKNTENYPEHYNPQERYCMNYISFVDMIKRSEFKKFLSEYPNSFRLIFKEAARVIEQNEQELFLEFQLTEAYFVYVFKYSKDDEKYMGDNNLLNKLIQRAIKNW